MVLRALPGGLGMAWALSRLVSRFLFQVQAGDVAIYLSVAALLMLAGIAAASIPARRAARVDPLNALRSA